jgi:uncharacterized protein YceK
MEMDAARPHRHIPGEVINRERTFQMKNLMLMLSCVLLLTGCTNPTTIESRKQERAAAYAAWSRDHQAATDQGRLLAGMTTDAAYVAWGRPNRIITEGTQTTWLYQESDLKEHKSTTVRSSRRGISVSGFTEETSVLYPHTVVRAKIVFTNGLVKEWQRSDRPTY